MSKKKTRNTEPKKRAISPYFHTCRVCGKPYKAKVWNQQTCSPKCRELLNKGRVRVDESQYKKSRVR